MKKTITLIGFIIIIYACKDEAIEWIDEPEQEVPAYVFSENDVVKGRMRIKLLDEPAGTVTVRSVGGTVTTGINILDRAASSTLGIIRMERTFPHAGKYEERSRREGLHLWYDVWFNEEIAATRAAHDLSGLEGIAIAAPVLKVVSTAAPAIPAFPANTKSSTRANSLPFNDEYLPYQWNYYNDGSEDWKVEGADIRLINVWEQYNGHPDIIVAIVDGGIYVDHPDLKANLWINKNEIDGNGLDDDENGYADDIYGYNFVSGTGTITPNRHGTHVAGTIAATNNNGIGVCGIAGGNGTANSGVRLMSCQVFEHPYGNYNLEVVAENIAPAIKYGADNGAVISQNSWGYAADVRSTTSNGTRSSYIDPAHKEAIDYFIKYAGCDNDGNQLPDSPMKGGIVLFAVGNNNTSNPRVAAPADYEKVLGVAAIGPDYIKGPYSNYGEYVDISAPGGISSRGIYSTTISNLGYYEYRYGTSMSCPHVAGVAALVIEKYGVGKQGFTAQQLEKILLKTAYNIDSYNPDFIGKLGTGCVDAYSALNTVIMEDQEEFILDSGIINDGNLIFEVGGNYVGKAHIIIYNSIGSKVMEREVEVRKYVSTTIDISKLSAGYYTLEYITDEGTVKKNFIKY